MGQQFLGLSLFIILLSFFIVLTSLSDYNDTKSQPVLDSLGMAFKGRTTGHEKSPVQSQREDEQEQKGDTLDKIEALFTGQIKALKVQKNRLGTHMYVRMPLSEFEPLVQEAADVGVSQKNVLQGQGGSFLPTLVSLTETDESGIPYRMDITLEVDGDPAEMQNENPKKLAENMKKASGFAAVLEKAGMPAKRISGGVAISKEEDGPEKVQYVELFFQRYAPLDLSTGKTLKDIGEENG